MANSNPSRLGQANAAGDDRALFLKIFSGMVLAAFHNTTEFRPRTMVRSISHGKSAQFPVVGRATAKFHTPGTELVGSTIKQNERVITIEDVLLADAFIANIDELLNHYDLRSIYASELGDVLAQAYDAAVAQTDILTARAAAVVDGLPGGGHDNNASYDTDGTVLWKGVYTAGIKLDQNFVPKADRSAFFDPVRYALIVQSEKPINFDLNQGANPNGSIASGTVAKVNDIVIVKTNNLPSTDLRADLTINSARRADYSVTRGLIKHRSGSGVLQAQDVTMESAYDIRRQGTLMLAKYLIGLGALRPEAEYELRTGDPS